MLIGTLLSKCEKNVLVSYFVIQLWQHLRFIHQASLMHLDGIFEVPEL